MGDFLVNIGHAEVLQAELIGVKEGLKVARDLGIRRLRIDVDSSLSVLLLTSPPSSHSCSYLIADCIALLAMFDHALVRHICREGNRCADRLATMAQTSPPGVTVLNAAPVELRPLLSSDSRGISFLSPSRVFSISSSLA